MKRRLSNRVLSCRPKKLKKLSINVIKMRSKHVVFSLLYSFRVLLLSLSLMHTYLLTPPNLRTRVREKESRNCGLFGTWARKRLRV
jgi:hypothetical protein